jgi:hypothetical protein
MQRFDNWTITSPSGSGGKGSKGSGGGVEIKEDLLVNGLGEYQMRVKTQPNSFLKAGPVSAMTGFPFIVNNNQMQNPPRTIYEELVKYWEISAIRPMPSINVSPIKPEQRGRLEITYTLFDNKKVTLTFNVTYVERKSHHNYQGFSEEWNTTGLAEVPGVNSFSQLVRKEQWDVYSPDYHVWLER